MQLLPCLQVGSDRWWLPLSSGAAATIGRILLDHRRSTDDVPSIRDPRQLAHVVAALRTDPPLLIHTALSMSLAMTHGDGSAVYGEVDLADWLVANAASRFADGEAFLSAPRPSGDQRERWSTLEHQFRRLPWHRWIDDAAAYLRVAGPAVPWSWQSVWPRLEPSEDSPAETSASVTASPFLQQLARRVRDDQTLREAFDAQLHQAKMAAIERLAYGLSHEINNPLANISTRAQQLQRGENDPSRRATLQRIIDQVYRAHEMIADLMFYANPPRAEPTGHDIGELLRESFDLWTAEAERQSIRMDLQLPDDPIRINVDGPMIRELISILIRNAIEAIGCQGTIVLQMISEPNGYAPTVKPTPHPRRIMIHVADSGPGLSAEARRHAFDPYYSGREAGRGLGLGLCKAYRIAGLHDATISLAGGPAGCVATVTFTPDP